MKRFRPAMRFGRRLLGCLLALWLAQVGARGQEPWPEAVANDPFLKRTQAETAQPLPALPQPAAPTLAGELARSTTAASARAEALRQRRSTYGTLESFRSGGIPVMIGDLSPATRLLRVQPFQGPDLPPPFPPPRPPKAPGDFAPGSILLAPTVRAIKVSENQSPRPQDRIYYSFNFFEGINDAANQRLLSPVGNMKVFRNIFGFEKTFWDGDASIGLRLPLNTLTADANNPRYRGLTGTDTALGNLDIITKFLLLEDEDTGSLLSAGLVITPPTGPAAFAGAGYFIDPPNPTTLQPYVGGIWMLDRLYFQGFSGLDVPTADTLPTLWYNDVGLGYLLRNEPDSGRWLTLIAPTFEVHVNTPMTHRGAYSLLDPADTPDNVNLTYGLNLGFGTRLLLSLAMVTPVTGPRPFDYEFLALFNFYFGGPRPVAPIPPVLGL